jgi:hypothetical protein
VLTGARATAKRRRDRGKERRQLKLITRAKEGTIERRGGVAGEVMAALIALMPLKTG